MMEWDTNCCIGFDAVDSRREELFGILRKLVGKTSGRSIEKIHNALKATAQYASQVFPIEEELMREIFYPGLISHQEDHQKLKKEVSIFLSGVNEAHEEELEKIVRFLVAWLDHHLLGSDIRFSEYKQDTHIRQENMQKEIKEIEIKRRPIEKVVKLKHLFKEKLISIDDFKERKVKVFAEYLRERGLNQLKQSISDLENFQKEDHLSEKEKKRVVSEFLGNVDLKKSLDDLPEIEEKLILLNSFYEFELVEESIYLDFKDKVLSQL